MTTSIALVDDARFDAHEERSGRHPECPERLTAARSGLFGVVPPERRMQLAPRRASDEELRAVHPDSHLARLRAGLASGWGQLDADTFFSPGTEEATWLAAGGAADLARELMAGPCRRGVGLLRPPGHHAEPDASMGFCLLNNVAIAAHSALAAGAQRVAIVDWDVHHGNGTQAAFYADPRVLFISAHQYPFYPGTGAAHETGGGAGAGHTVNLALPAGAGPETYGDGFRRVVMPVLDAFGADLVLVSAGFDAHGRDPLAQMELDEATYQAMASALLSHVDAAGHGRIGFILEGGYNLPALEASVAAVGKALLGHTLDLPEGAPSPRHRSAIDATVSALQPHHPTLR